MRKIDWTCDATKQPIEASIRRVDQMKHGSIIKGRGRPNINSRWKETIKKDLDLNGLSEYLVFDRTQWHRWSM